MHILEINHKFPRNFRLSVKLKYVDDTTGLIFQIKNDGYFEKLHELKSPELLICNTWQ